MGFRLIGLDAARLRGLTLAVALAGAALAVQAETAASAPISVFTTDAAVGADDVAAVEAIVRREYNGVARFLGIEQLRPIRIHVGAEYRGRTVEVSVAYTTSGLILIPTRIYQRGLMPTAHELTHIMAGLGANLALTEGLAILAHDRHGEQRAFPNFGMPVKAALTQRLNRLASAAGSSPADARRAVEAAINGGRTPNASDLDRWIADFGEPNRRMTAYLMAGAFTEYLLDAQLAGDMSAMMRVYKSGGYVRETGRSADELMSAWWTGLFATR